MNRLSYNGKTLNFNGKFITSPPTPPADPNFYSLNQTVRSWYGIAAAPNGNVYAPISNGDIYMQTNGIGDFNPLGQTSRTWRSIAVAPNGNVYVALTSGDIYMQTNGIGDFNPLGQTSRTWRGIAVAPNGNVYAGTLDGDIYMQTNGIGDFNSLGQFIISILSVSASPNGDIYVGTLGNGLWKQTNGTGNFNLISDQFTNVEGLFGITITQNNDIYIVVSDGDQLVYDIYVQTNGIGDFNPLGQINRTWRFLTTHPNGNVYATVGGASGNIYMQTN